MVTQAGVALRPLERTDLEAWRGWINDPEIAGALDRVLPVTREEHEAFYVRHVVEDRSAVWFAVEHDGRHVGNVWLWDLVPRHRRAELRVMIGDRRAWGHGIGTSAIGTLTSYAFLSLGLEKVYAYVMARNPRAKASFERAGYREEVRLEREVRWNGAREDVWRLARFA